MSETQPNITNPDMNFEVGERVRWGRDVTFGPNCKNVRIGHGAFFGHDLYIDVEELVIGDYFTMHHGGIIHGEKTQIGHNCWIGHYSVLDSVGGSLTLGNNIGIGAHSQLWTHIKFGDVLEGCRWQAHGTLTVEDDVWFVGHCIVSPIVAKKRSMLMVGSVVTKDMEENRIYAGSPARDMTDKFGEQFRTDVSVDEKEAGLKALFDEFAAEGGSLDAFEIVRAYPDAPREGVTYFNVADRTEPSFCPQPHENPFRQT
jgi:acetyltransferase-like isoleucine patch superfamily enzyme